MSLNFSFMFLTLLSPLDCVLFDLCVLDFAPQLCSAFWSDSLLSFKISLTLYFVSKISNWNLFIVTPFYFIILFLVSCLQSPS